MQKFVIFLLFLVVSCNGQNPLGEIGPVHEKIGENSPSKKNNSIPPALIPPIFTSINPSRGSQSGGTTLTINGNNLTTSMSVKVGPNSCLTTIYISSSQIRCTTPAGPLGLADVILIVPGGGNITLTNIFTYINPTEISTIGPGAGVQSSVNYKATSELKFLNNKPGFFFYAN